MIDSPLFEGLGLPSGVSTAGGGDPEKPTFHKRFGKDVDTADARDALANMVGFGATTMDHDMSANYGRLMQLYGKPTADKLLNHVMVFNSRKDMLKASPQEKLSAFYGIGSRDDEISQILNSVKSFGKGPLAALNESRNEGSQMLSKRVLPVPSNPINSTVQNLSDKYQ